jgi:hypothetical protein
MIFLSPTRKIIWTYLKICHRRFIYLWIRYSCPVLVRYFISNSGEKGSLNKRGKNIHLKVSPICIGGDLNLKTDLDRKNTVISFKRSPPSADRLHQIKRLISSITFLLHGVSAPVHGVRRTNLQYLQLHISGRSSRLLQKNIIYSFK